MIMYDNYEYELEVEKELKVERWIELAFVRRIHDTHPDIVRPETLHVINIPLSMNDRWFWLFRWREARYQCIYPKDHIYISRYDYDRTTGYEMGYKKPYNRVISAKGWVTRVERLIKRYEAKVQGELFQDLENDPVYQRLKDKLIEKKMKLADAEKDLEESLKK